MRMTKLRCAVISALALCVRTDIVKWGKLIERLGLRID